MLLATGVGMLKIIGNMGNIKPPPSPGQVLTGLFVLTPILVGSTFCVGTQFGKAIGQGLGHLPIKTKIEML